LNTLLKGEEIYSAISTRIKETKSIKTIRLMNILLATAPELHHVRLQLRTNENELFQISWEAWQHCAVSSVCLALISQRYINWHTRLFGLYKV